MSVGLKEQLITAHVTGLPADVDRLLADVPWGERMELAGMLRTTVALGDEVHELTDLARHLDPTIEA